MAKGKPAPRLPTHKCCGHSSKPNDWVATCRVCGKMGCRHCMVIENLICQHHSCPLGIK